MYKAYKHMKRCSTLFFIQQIQIKTAKETTISPIRIFSFFGKMKLASVGDFNVLGS